MDYKNTPEPAEALKEHLSITNQFTGEMIERFEPHQLNEINARIREVFSAHIKLMVDDAKNKLQYLQDVLSNA